MMLKSLTLALAVVLPFAEVAAAEPAKHLKGHRHSARAAVPPPLPSGARSEPRMIEARPGVWVSTWEHIIDEGQGRWMVETREP
jgi:hypothetical protein